MVRLLALFLLLAPSLAAADDYRQRLDKLDHQLMQLRSLIFESRAHLEALKRRVLGGDAGTRGLIVQRNKMGPTYSLIEAEYALDGNQIFLRADERGIDDRALLVFQAPLAPAAHTLSVRLVFKGSGGPFTYVDLYRFTLRGSHTFTAADGKETRVEVIGHERGNPVTTRMQDRPAIDFHDSIAR